jgi:hypothetical protein
LASSGFLPVRQLGRRCFEQAGRWR